MRNESEQSLVIGSYHRRLPIGPLDVVDVKGRYLVKRSTQQRFLIEGIAFPIPPPPPKTTSISSVSYNVTGWIAVLEQLANDLEINTIRIYNVDCQAYDYSEFFRRAAALGVYIMVPLTAAKGSGVLDRTLTAPACYPPALFNYGRQCLDQFLRHPNIVAGLVGNEVMNDLDAWNAAPCVAAYGRDLKKYMHLRMDSAKSEKNIVIANATTIHDDNGNDTGEAEYNTAVQFRMLPLLYAAQYDSPDAVILPDAAMKLTANYLTCALMDDDDDDNDNKVPPQITSMEENSYWSMSQLMSSSLSLLPTTSAIDIFGINVESWCSSLQTYELNEDNTENPYHALVRTFASDATTNTSTSCPLVMTEIGCSRELFNRDNGLPRFTRDWKQVPVIIGTPMRTVFSGFSAYTYDGNPLFQMTNESKSWDGVHVLDPSLDYFNFQLELQQANENLTTELAYESAVAEMNGNSLNSSTLRIISCRHAMADLKKYWNLDLMPLQGMPSWIDDHVIHSIRDILSPTHAPLPPVTFSTTAIRAVAALWKYFIGSHPVVLVSMATLGIVSCGLFAYWKKAAIDYQRVLSYHQRRRSDTANYGVNNKILVTPETYASYGSVEAKGCSTKGKFIFHGDLC